MPLRDHFRPPLSIQRPWESFHSAWVNALVQELNQQLLPPEYYALPMVKLGSHVEIDVAAMKAGAGQASEPGGVATQVWAPPQPALAARIDFTELDAFTVEIRHEARGPRLHAAIELVSPANKDRPSHRLAFAIKCASYLQQGSSIILVDVVTERRDSLHVRLLQLLNLLPQTNGSSFPELYASIFRTTARDGERVLENWLEALIPGGKLPIIPLWLEEELVLPLDLERSYRTTCDTLRITEYRNGT